MSESRTEQVSAQSRGVRVVASEARGAAERSVLSPRSVRAARPAAVSARSGVVHQSCRHRSCGLSVRWRPAHRRLFANKGGVGVCSTNRLFLKQGMNENKQPKVCSRKCRCSSSALRSTAAPGCGVRVGTGFARAAGARVLRHQGEDVALVVLEGLLRSQQRPNPSFEGTSSGMLRMPTAAPQVKR